MTILTERTPASRPHSPTADRPHRSASQYNDYARCPKCYELKRITKVPQRPDAWTAEGKAVHAAIEALERSGRQMNLAAMQTVFTEAYRKEIEQSLAVTPNLDYWANSGPYAAEEDIQRRRKLGLEICALYYAWCQAHPDQVPIEIDGRSAVELELRFDLDGVPVLAYLDQVAEYPGRGPRIRDAKTGKTPSDHFALGVYRIGLELVHGISTEPEGDYWLGKTGRLSRTKDLSMYTVEFLTDAFGQLDQDINAERFDPTPSPAVCRSCSVSAWCSSRAI